MGIIIDISRWSQWIQTQRQALDKLDRWKTVLVRWCYASYLQHTRLCSSSTGSDSSDYSWKTQKNATASTLLLFTSLFHYRVSTLTCFTVNKCIGDDTKAAARQSLNCIKNKKKIKYGEKRYSICRMEFLHPAMWQDHNIDFVIDLQVTPVKFSHSLGQKSHSLSLTFLTQPGFRNPVWDHTNITRNGIIS